MSRMLALVRPGETVRLSSIEAGGGLRCHLASMGLHEGVEIRVIANAPHGPFIVALGCARLALGRGMAAKIFVE